MDENNPPAFPLACPNEFQFAHDGMTLRDWFAGQALAAMDLSRHGVTPGGALTLAAGEAAYAYADALLAARKGQGNA